MIEQVNTAIRFYAFFVASKVGKTGLAVTADVYNPAGALVVTAGAAVEVGGGLYAYTLASGGASEGEYVAIFKTADATVDTQHVPSLWSVGRAGVENLDAPVSVVAAVADGLATTVAPLGAAISTLDGKVVAVDGVVDGIALTVAPLGAAMDDVIAAVSPVAGSLAPIVVATEATEASVAAMQGSIATILNRVSAASIEVVAPVAADASVTIVRGDTYAAADGRALSWTSGAYPNLTGATITMTVRNYKDVVILTKNGTATSASTAQVELTAADTNLALGPAKYDVQAQLAAVLPAVGSIITLARGVLTVLEDRTR